MNKITELTERLKAVLGEARDIAAKTEADNRDFTDTERETIGAKMREASDLKTQLEKARADAQLRSTIAELGDSVGLADRRVEQQPNGLWTPEAGVSLGEHYVKSPEYQALLATAPGGHFSKDHRIAARPVGYRGLLPRRGAKTLVTGASDTSAGAFVANDIVGLQAGLGAFQRPLRLRDLVTQGATESDTVEYVRITAATNAAAPTAEATATSGSSGTKPESALATVKVTEPVKTIAHWIPVTKRALSDAAQMRTLIDNFLLYGLEEELEDQMIAGDGTGENFTGLASVSGVQAQAWDTNLFTTARKAITKVRTVGRSIPTGWALNPTDVETLDLQQDEEGRYYFGGPAASGGVATLWRIPVVETEAVTAGTGYIGDWRKVVLWDREQATITTTDSHSDWFIRNMVAILAESRHAFGVLQPSAFVEVALSDGASA